MQSPAQTRIRQGLISSSTLATILFVPLLAVIVFAIWVSVSSISENVRFGRGVDQLVQIISTTRHLAAKNPTMFITPGANAILEMQHAGASLPGQVGPNAVNAANGLSMFVKNPWDGTISATIYKPSVIRIETSLPARACLKSATFLARDVRGLGIQLMETRTTMQAEWQRFFDRQSTASIQAKDIEAACLQGTVTLALVIGVR